MNKLMLFVMAGAMAVNAFAQQTFNLGGDISMLPQYESAKTPYLLAQTSLWCKIWSM